MEEKLRQANAAAAEGKKDVNDEETDKLKAELETFRKFRTTRTTKNKAI